MPIIILLAFGCKNIRPEQTSVADIHVETMDDIIYTTYSRSDKVDSVIGYRGTCRVFAELYQDGDRVYQAHYDDHQLLVEQRFYFEGVLVDGPNGLESSYLSIFYDSTGLVRTTGIQGFYKGTGIPVGTWKEYNEGKLVRNIYYHLDTFGADYIRFSDYKYYDSTQTMREVYTNNFVLYETDSVPLNLEEYERRRNQ